MPFYLVGLGLGDVKDITVKGLEVVRKCSKVYLEAYTSILMGQEVGDASKLAEFYERDVTVADREFVESGEVLEGAKEQDIALLVVGDPFGATTHSDLVVRCHEQGIPVESVGNSTILTAVGVCGLQLYRFGQAISLCFWTDTWRPDSWFAKMLENRKAGLHTLALLDIKVKEQSMENLARGRKIYEPPRFMTVNQGVEQILEVAEKTPDCGITRETLAVGVARLGSPDQVIVAGSLGELLDVDFGSPLHSLVLCGDVHESEEEHLALYYTPQQKAAYLARRQAEREKRS